MPQKPEPKIIHRTINGKAIDMDKLRARNELTPAIGNIRVNARGDELGKNGKIVRSRDDILQDFYNLSQPVPQPEAPVAVVDPVPMPTPVVEPEPITTVTNTPKRTSRIPDEKPTEPVS